MHALKSLAHSLQETSRVLSNKGQSEQSMLQESVIQLLGICMLEGQSHAVPVDEVGADLVTRTLVQRRIDNGDIATAIGEIDYQVLTGSVSGNLLALVKVEDADDWDGLPVLLQNFVAEEQLPCVLSFAITKLVFKDDAPTQYYVLPIFATLSIGGSLTPYYTFADEEQRKRVLADKVEMGAAAAEMLEPYLRMLTWYAINKKPVQSHV